MLSFLNVYYLLASTDLLKSLDQTRTLRRVSDPIIFSGEFRQLNWKIIVTFIYSKFLRFDE